MSKPKSKQKAAATISLSASRDIPFDKLMLSQANVRRIKAGVSIEELAEDIARRTLLQSLTVRAVLDDDGTETGIFEIPAGGRRYRALELLVKQKRLAPTAPIPCVIRTEGIAEEDSLAENIQRAPLHPLDQFRAFKALRDKGQSEEEIAAAFFVSGNVVKQRLKLAAVSETLLGLYADDQMTLEQLMAFTVNPDHERQNDSWEAISKSYSREPHHIRRMLTGGAVRASDRRALFVGLEAYQAAGGVILRDLFEADDGGWLQDSGLLNTLCAEKLEAAADLVRAEGWKWTETAVDLPYGCNFGMRELVGEKPPLTEEEQAVYDAFKAEQANLEEAHASDDELPEEVDQRLGELEAAIEAIEDRPSRYDADEIARAGVFIALDSRGLLHIQRGFVRPEDELPVELEAGADSNSADGDDASAEATDAADAGDDHSSHSSTDDDEDDSARPIPDRLMTELTQWRTVALRDALGANPDIAFLAALHALVLKLFYAYGVDSCLEINATQVMFRSDAAGLAESVAATSIDTRHDAWSARLPDAPEALWDALIAFNAEDRMALFAHCVALTVTAVVEPYNQRRRPLAHAETLCTTLGLDMIAAGWTPTAESYFGRVTKARILEAVREAKGDAAAERIAGLKKPEMAIAAEGLLNESGWLPELLRTQAATGDRPTEDQSDTDDPSGEFPATPAIAAE